MNPLASHAMKSIIKAYKRDRDHLVRLDEDYYVGDFAETFSWKDADGKPVDLPILDFRCEAFEIKDRRLVCFKADKPRCDGATLAPDKVGTVDIAPGYIPHDDLYAAMRRMAEDPAWKAAGWTDDAIRALADAVLAWLIEDEERRVHPEREPWIYRVYHAGVRLFGGVAHRIGISCIVALLAVGCYEIPAVFTPSGERPVYTVVPRSQASDPATVSSGQGNAGVSSDVAGSVSSPSGSDAPSSGASSGSAPEGDSSPVLDFCFGGFRGGRAVEDSRCRISKLKIGSDSLSFKWDTGIPSDWQRGDTEKGPMIVACAFCFDGEKWIGGKFDWIDEHRTSRSLENIKGGYGGWLYASWQSATRRAFCVVSADGKYRSNLLED